MQVKAIMHISLAFKRLWLRLKSEVDAPLLRYFIDEDHFIASAFPCQADLNGVYYLLINSHLLVLLLHAYKQGHAAEKKSTR